MAQPNPRKTLPWKGCLDHTLIDDDDRARVRTLVEEDASVLGLGRVVFLVGEEEGEGGENEDEDEDDDDTNNIDQPTSCFGHFDRTDVDFTTPKSTMQPKVYVFHGERVVATWSGSALLQHAEVSQRWDSVCVDAAATADVAADVAATERLIGQPEVEDNSETEGQRTPMRGPPCIVVLEPSDSEDDQESDDQESDDQESERLAPSRTISSGVKDPHQRQQRNSHPPSASPKSILEKLRVSHTAILLPGGEDPFFAGRLAATSVIMVREGQLAEAKRLGRWSVDLVGKREWDKMVENFGSAPRLDGDDADWMASMLDDVDTALRSIDEERAAELRGMRLEWQHMGVLPRRSMSPPGLRDL